MTAIIIKYWIEFAFGIISAGLIAGFRHLLKKQKAIENGVKALLRDRIIQSCNNYREKGYCPIYARDSINNLFKEYKELGGNGTIEALVNETRELPWEKAEV